MPPTTDGDALREKVADAQSKLDDLRTKWRTKPTETTGVALLKARQEASEALQALWDEFPQEKPPTQFVI